MYNDFDDKDPKGTENPSDGFSGQENGGDGNNPYGFDGNSFHEYGNTEENSRHPDYAFEALGDLSKPKTRAFSIASLILGILSLICCCGGFVGFAFGVLAIVFAIVARRHLGYFDGMSIAGMTCGIVGAVLGLLLGILSLSGFFDDIINSPDFPGGGGNGGDDINNRF